MSVLQEVLMKTLFNGIIREDVDFDPIFEMADELFTHLGIACTLFCHQFQRVMLFIITSHLVQNPGSPKLGTGTLYLVSDSISKNTDELLRDAEGFGKQRQTALKTLVRCQECHLAWC